MTRRSVAASGLFAALALTVACGEPSVPEASTTEILTARTAGLTFLQQDRLVEAEAEFSRLIRLAPQEATGYAELALVHLRAGDLEDAERRIRRALEIEPDNPEIGLILARVLEALDRPSEAVQELERSLAAVPGHPRTLFALAELAAGRDDSEASRSERAGYLARIVEELSGNLAARLQLAEARLRTGEHDPAIGQLEALRQQAADFPRVAAEAFERTIDAARASDTASALRALAGFRRYFEVTAPYQAAMQELRGPAGTLVGSLNLTFSHEFSLRVQEEAAVLAALRFTEATAVAGLEAVVGDTAAVIAAGDFDGDGDLDLFAATGNADGETTGYLLRSDLGRFVEMTDVAGLARAGRVTAAAFGDYDGDRRLDLFLVDEEVNTLYHNEGDGLFSDVTGRAGVSGDGGGNAVLFVDLDLDGDLDLYEARRGPNRFYRNNGDGGFVERARGAGIAGDAGADSRVALLADFDDDRDIDLLVIHAEGPPSLYSNERGGSFTDVTEAVGLAAIKGGRTGAIGDFDNDGWFDLFIGGAGSEGHLLLRNRGDGSFEPDLRSADALGALRLEARASHFLDFDNDGHLDLVVAGAPLGAGAPRLALLRNDGSGRLVDASEHLPEEIRVERGARVDRVIPADYNEDGDLDLFLAMADGSVKLLRNDGANANHYFTIDLVGLGVGSGKNNRFGIGSRVQVRTGDLLQTRVVTEPRTHFGLDGRLKADVVRIEWTNGVAQDLFFPGTDQDLIEQRQLKGSCAFLYAWDGERYEFVTDVMWRSALGMPLGILGGDGRSAFAPAFPSQEYVRLAGDRLRPSDGEFRIRLTEELWETAYLDQVELIAVDHPASIEVRVDERFVPPAPTEPRLFRVGERHAPVSAVDERGVDHMAAIRAADDIYVSNLVPGKYQGTTRMHDLVLDLGDAARAEELVLYLTGWVFPSDASINVAMSQSGERPVFPYLEVRNEAGRWVRALELGFPSGKSKTVVADLSGIFPTPDRRVRIRTDLEIYWDHIFFSTGPSVLEEDEVRWTTLEPTAADLHYRGFSRLYRRGGRYGPHWFDYSDRSAARRWSDLEGLYTRYGDVRPLLLEPDDMYVILNAGDEVSLRFDASRVPDLPDGWTRTFLLYTDGWIKDGDLNTATGGTVEPLPFRAQTRYPYGSDESYPVDEEHQRYLSDYNTRVVTSKGDG